MKISRRQAALMAGIALLVMAVIAPIADMVIFKNVLDTENLTESIENFPENAGKFRVGIGLFVIVALLDVLIAWALYLLLEPLGRGLALLAGWFRLAYSAMLGLLVNRMMDVRMILERLETSSVLLQDQLRTQLVLANEGFYNGWQIALIVFSVHLVIVGILLIRARSLKGVLGWLLVIAGAGYAFDGFATVFAGGIGFQISPYTFIGEVILIFWLLAIGIKNNLPDLERAKK